MHRLYALYKFFYIFNQTFEELAGSLVWGSDRDRWQGEAEVNQIAVVTGGGSGLGQAISVHLAQDGRRVAVLDIDGAAAENVAEELRAKGGQAVGVKVDVSDPEAVANAFGTVRDSLGPTEILVTSAAVAGSTRFDQITFDEWNRYLAVNLTGTFLCVQAALPRHGER